MKRENIGKECWHDRRLLDLLKLEIPIVQASMAGSDSVALARSASSTGALGSLACALLSPEVVREGSFPRRQAAGVAFSAYRGNDGAYSRIAQSFVYVSESLFILTS